MGAALGLCVSVGGRTAPPAIGAEFSPAEIRKLIEDAARNEVRSMQSRVHRYEYVHSDVEPQSTRTTLEIETAQGMVARLIELNGQPPSGKQCSRDLNRLARIASSPRLQQSRLKEQQGELNRREQLFRALPEAFIFQYDGADKDRGWVRVRYRPNPSFHPRSRVGAVLTGLAGTMWVDASSRRLVKIEGHVISTVTFGWGILARIYPGGHYSTEQMRLQNGDWRLETLQVNLRGVVMVIKKLNVNMKETYNSYHQVPRDLTLPAAVRMLERAPVKCGQ